MGSQQNLLAYESECNDDQPQAQLRRDEVGRGEFHNSSLIHQTGDSVKTMAYGAGDIASGAARGAMGLAQGAAMGAANLAHGAATTMRNTLGTSHERRDLHTRLPTAGPYDPRYSNY